MTVLLSIFGITPNHGFFTHCINICYMIAGHTSTVNDTGGFGMSKEMFTAQHMRSTEVYRHMLQHKDFNGKIH